MKERYSNEVLRECIELANSKSHDYQNPDSRIKQADYYPRGVETIFEIIWAKTLRMASLIEVMKNGGSAKNEALEDSAKDLINYASFMVSYARGKMDGQDRTRDMFNRPNTSITRLSNTHVEIKNSPIANS
jgi:hypothetical protein